MYSYFLRSSRIILYFTLFLSRSIFFMTLLNYTLSMRAWTPSFLMLLSLSIRYARVRFLCRVLAIAMQVRFETWLTLIFRYLRLVLGEERTLAKISPPSSSILLFARFRCLRVWFLTSPSPRAMAPLAPILQFCIIMVLIDRLVQNMLVRLLVVFPSRLLLLILTV